MMHVKSERANGRHARASTTRPGGAQHEDADNWNPARHADRRCARLVCRRIAGGGPELPEHELRRALVCAQRHLRRQWLLLRDPQGAPRLRSQLFSSLWRAVGPRQAGGRRDPAMGAPERLPLSGERHR
ncbi:hypothetical protein SI859A1_03420 [Aurantimonas manganoxydans SI85-9A1]|uniref:Uncharacterized protein n=1 Tax=Aurantimonas manganoxydans (strain ATCC BAA-1229 / DSM 21871 / SI85-9A1) TaxID=287752 RepID=Q1YEW1_AURMS|nr:hypothetical protein SI859A1_03420 [Aurantimonas manganoxydans SI85-9A1]